ncbi:uncharacterized protein LOC127786096 [Oryza glaberrima]|uniref:uncharacterized protein LOC127786096 n=1 Tax=Oryza glaberrima TaxID=4538 RepID=UPI00224C4BD5|nr:uncharacterized protein LOC127786096 [Oryza glaberrima]
MSLLPFHFFFSLDSAAAQGRPAPGRRPAGAPCRRRLGPVVVVLILVVGALFLILGPTGSSSFTMPRIRTEFNEPVHVAVAAPPPPPTQMQAGVNTSGEEDSGLPPTTSASALTARSSCSTFSRRRASPPGSTPDPSASAARMGVHIQMLSDNIIILLAGFRLGFVRTSSLRLMIGWLRRHTMEESWRLMSSAL